MVSDKKRSEDRHYTMETRPTTLSQPEILGFAVALEEARRRILSKEIDPVVLLQQPTNKWVMQVCFDSTIARCIFSAMFVDDSKAPTCDPSLGPQPRLYLAGIVLGIGGENVPKGGFTKALPGVNLTPATLVMSPGKSLMYRNDRFRSGDELKAFFVAWIDEQLTALKAGSTPAEALECVGDGTCSECKLTVAGCTCDGKPSIESFTRAERPV